MRATLKRIKVELRRRWHDPIPETGKWIQRVLQGHQNYFSVPGNGSSIWTFFKEVSRLWLRRIYPVRTTCESKSFVSINAGSVHTFRWRKLGVFILLGDKMNF